MEDKYIEIIKKVRTKEEANRFLREIEVVLSSYFRVGEEARKKLLESQISYPTAQYFQTMIDSASQDHTAFEKALHDVKEKVENAPICHITISFDPHETTIDKLSVWLRENFDKTSILDLSVDPSILGGAKIAYAGRYKDLSLKAKLDKYFESGFSLSS